MPLRFESRSCINGDSRLRPALLEPGVTRLHEIPDDLMPEKNKRILIVEDDPAISELLTTILSTQPFDLTAVPNGAEGLKRVLADDYDLIICDMVMPGFPGDMFYRAVERVRPHLCSRFLFVTGHNGDPRVDGFIRSIRGLMLFKPFQLHELSTAMEVVLHKGQPRRG